MLIQFFDVQPFIASLAGMFAARGLAFLVSLSSIKVEDPAILWLQTKLFYIDGWFLSPTGIIALLVVARRRARAAFTRFGRTIYAIGGNEQSARLMGLPVVRTKLLAYVDQRHLRRSGRASSSPPTRVPATRSTASAPSSTPSRRSSSAARC